jgi:hypothetical protein
MKLVSQTKKGITVELTPLQLELLRSAMAKELSQRRRAWKTVSPKFPEELMYHAIMKETSEKTMYNINSYISVYREWGVLK